MANLNWLKNLAGTAGNMVKQVAIQKVMTKVAGTAAGVTGQSVATPGVDTAKIQQDAMVKALTQTGFTEASSEEINKQAGTVIPPATQTVSWYQRNELFLISLPGGRYLSAPVNQTTTAVLQGMAKQMNWQEGKL